MNIAWEHYNYYRAMKYYYMKGNEEMALRMYKCLVNKKHVLTSNERKRCAIKYIVRNLV